MSEDCDRVLGLQPGFRLYRAKTLESEPLLAIAFPVRQSELQCGSECLIHDAYSADECFVVARTT